MRELIVKLQRLKKQTHQLADALGGFRLGGAHTAPAKVLAVSVIRQASHAAKRTPAPAKRAPTATRVAATRPAAPKPAARPVVPGTPAAAAPAAAGDASWETF